MRELLAKVRGAKASAYVRWARNAAVLLGCGYGSYLFLAEVHEHYPLEHWLVWSYAQMWLWCLVFTAACFSSGTLLMSRLVPKGIPMRERLVFIMPAGCLVFFYGIFALGIAHALSPWTAVGLAALLIASGAVPAYRLVRRTWRHVRAVRRRGVEPLAWWHYPAGLFGIVCTGALYFAILSPRNIAFDAHFYHLGIAQQYVAEGAIARSPESWWVMAIPHLSSVLYTWSMLLPGLNDFEHLVCSAHLEFIIFVWTLLSIPTLVRWLAPGAKGRLSWVAVYLFPGIMLYDSLLSTASDHITAFWAVPIFLAFRRAWNALDWRDAALFALMLSGAILTKYQAFYFAFTVIALTLRALWLLGKELVKRRAFAHRVLTGLLVAGAVTLLATSAHWLKNWAFYGDPLFPYLAKWLHPEGHAPDVARLFAEWNEWQMARWRFEGTTGERLAEGVKVLFTFSIEHHDFPQRHGKAPVFGSLFTLTTVLVLPFLQRTKRAWGLVLATHAGIFFWFWTLPVDRYLQLLLPWMAASTAAAFALAWREGIPARVGVIVLSVFQVFWGGDVYFFPAHAMTKQSPAVTTTKLLALGHQKKYEARFTLGRLFQIGRTLPEDATVLLHEHNPRLGLKRPVVSDGAGWQLGIRYELLAGPRAVHELLRELGVTHIVSRRKKSRMWDGIGGDLHFFEYLERYAKPVKSFGGFTLFEIAKEPPPETGTRYVAYLGCGRFYQPGLYEVAQLHVREKGKPKFERIDAPTKVPRNPKQLGPLLNQATFVVTGNRCRYNAPKGALKDFELLAKRKRESLYIRRR